jgi:Fe-S cluster assembly protein SufD
MAVTTPDRALVPYLDAFAAAKAALPGLGAVREAAILRFAERGFPTLRDEAWKYTNLLRHLRTAFVEAGAGRIDAGALARFGVRGPSHRLVFVNGRFAQGLSDLGALAAGIVLMPMADALGRDAEDVADGFERFAPDDGLAALNTALMRDGLYLSLDRGATLTRPVDLIFVAVGEGAPAGLHPRNLVVLGADCEATVFETYVGFGAAPYWTNAVTDVLVGRGARLRHGRLQAESASGLHVGRVRVRLDAAADYSGSLLSTGASLSRNEIAVAMTGDGATCSLRGGALVRGRQHGDITTEIEHKRPHGASRQLFKNVVDDQARTVFQGRVVVQRDAQKTDAHQSSRNLLLSHAGQADTKPELRILADDVKCSHGATVGELDRNALFYLKSRGVPEAAARALLIEAFVAEIVDETTENVIAEPLRRAIGDWLAAGGVAREAA